MTFTTIHFLIFFALVFPLYFVVPRCCRRPLLLISSYYFYMCSGPWYISVIIAITLIDFTAALAMERASTPGARRSLLILSIISNFGLLFAFKYTGFMTRNLNDAFGLSLPVLNFVLPLGISFHTFQAVSYVVEVYRRMAPAERNLLNYALYVAFFPQMVAGPIERPHSLLPQFHVEHELRFENVQAGFRIALWGVFKKAVVADLLATAVNKVYSHPQQFTGPILILATLFFSIQIYCDFSGYSEIAIGIARMMGFRLTVNFRQPYLAESVGAFWRRWHISLSTWFRDYLYLPLGGSRVPRSRYFANLMIVFLVSGLWHGANWTFVVWGALHGSYLVLGTWTAPLRHRLNTPRFVEVLLTFSLVTFAWIFFRANNVSDGLYVATHLLNVGGFRLTDLLSLGLPRFELILAFVLIAVVAVAEYLMAAPPGRILQAWEIRPVRLVAYNACLFAVVFFGVFGRIDFIYFQF
jgi:D-alanyl-lipoteichoic acid acyltransferase DltB (MBOAT superfamily)